MTAPESSSPLDLEAIRRRVEAATPGPWEVTRDVEDVDNTIVRAAANWFEAYGQRMYGVRFVVELAEGNLNEADAEFIAAAREAVPALLAALEEAQREAEQWKADLKTAVKSMAPVVEKARRWRVALLHGDSATYRMDLAAAVDTYESQTGGTDA